MGWLSGYKGLRGGSNRRGLGGTLRDHSEREIGSAGVTFRISVLSWETRMDTQKFLSGGGEDLPPSPWWKMWSLGPMYFHPKIGKWQGSDFFSTVLPLSSPTASSFSGPSTLSRSPVRFIFCHYEIQSLLTILCDTEKPPFVENGLGGSLLLTSPTPKKATEPKRGNNCCPLHRVSRRGVGCPWQALAG